MVFVEFSIELQKTLRQVNVTVWQDLITAHFHLEQQISEGFATIPTKTFREGNLKTSFIYLLIDPRISENLPGESQVWQSYDSKNI